MVRFFVIFGIICFACTKAPQVHSFQSQYTSDYFDADIDTVAFQVFLKIPIIPIDTEVWVKSIDTIVPGNFRHLVYHISSNSTNAKRYFIIRDNGIVQSAILGKKSLTVFKPFQVSSNSPSSFIFERDSQAVRQFNTQFQVQNLSPFYSGQTILSVYEQTENTNDGSAFINREWENYGYLKGLVRIREDKEAYINGRKTDDKTYIKLRYK